MSRSTLIFFLYFNYLFILKNCSQLFILISSNLKIALWRLPRNVVLFSVSLLYIIADVTLPVYCKALLLKINTSGSEQGELRVNEIVTDYWRETGKNSITVVIYSEDQMYKTVKNGDLLIL